MVEFKRDILIKRIIRYIAIILLTFSLTSCFNKYSDDADLFIAGQNNTYKGRVIDTNGNPVSGKTIVLKSIFDQLVAEFITDDNGFFEGQGDIYDMGIQVEIKNEENFLNVNNNFVLYAFDYTEYPSSETIEFPPLIYAPISYFSIDITNNTGANYVAEFQFILGACTKSFENNIETYSLCYVDETKNFNLGTATGAFRRSVFVVRGSTISVTLTNDLSTITESFLIDEINQVESIVFE